MAFVERLIDVIFVLGEGNFGQAGQNTVTISGLRASATVANAGGRSMGTLDARIYGMRLATMNKLSTLGMVVTAQRKNSVTLLAYNRGEVPATVFQGTINNAWAEFSGAPDVPFHVVAQTGLFDAVQPAQALSIKGSADVGQMISGLAVQMGVAFENNGVTAKLANPYYSGSPRQQALQIVQDAGIMWNGVQNGILAIWNPGGSRGGTVPLVSPTTGMIGYPTYTANGLSVKTLFNPSIGLGTKIKIDSSLTPACGEWVVYKIDHHLETKVTRGEWQSILLAAPPGLGPFVA